MFADFRMTLSLPQIGQLISAGFLPAEPECPGDLRDALAAALAFLATVPMPLSATPNHELPTR